ncbi:MAG TPA: DinB family protein [Frankiaceae bacterium]|nr:DinB family protein [Frankiaceae bacterium]
MTPDDLTTLLARYRAGYAAVADAVAAAGPDRLDLAPAGGWTAREVVHHLADSEMTSAVRLRRLLAEDAPVVAAYDEEAFARLLHYRDRPVDAALRAIEASRATSAELLDRLVADDWRRAGTHTNTGPYGVTDWLRTYADHPHDHAAQLRAAAGI